MPINPIINMQMPPAIDFSGPINNGISIADMLQKRRMQQQQQPLVMQGLRQENQLNQQKIMDSETKRKHQELIGQAFKDATNPETGELDYNKIRPRIYSIDPSYGVELDNAQGMLDYHNSMMRNKTDETAAQIQKIKDDHDLALKTMQARIDELSTKNQQFEKNYGLDLKKAESQIDIDRQKLALEKLKAEKEGLTGTGLTKEQENDLQSTIKSYNPLLAGRSALGVAAKSINSLNQAEASLVKDRVTSDEARMSLRAIGDAYAAAGGAEIDPTLYGNLRGWIEKLTAHPMNILSKAQKTELLETIRTARDQNQRILNMNFSTGRSALGSILDNPTAKKRWEDIEKLYQNPTATVDESKINSTSTSGWNAAKEKRYQELLAKKNAGTIK